MYHDVTALPSKQGTASYFSVSSGVFARQLSVIADMGRRGCSIAEAISGGEPAPVAISFDDGNIGQAVHGFSRLVAHSMTATFFVTTDWVGRPGYVSWDHLREMRAAGMAIESHTHTHPFLSELSGDQLRDELRRSRDLLDEKLNQNTTMLAFPGGDRPKRSLRTQLSEHGYTVIGTSRWGQNEVGDSNVPRYVRRCTVRGEMPDAEFASIALGDATLGLRKGIREGVLAAIRSSLGPTRYSRWRRKALDLMTGSEARPS
jgi:hypothetical protein